MCWHLHSIEKVVLGHKLDVEKNLSIKKKRIWELCLSSVCALHYNPIAWTDFNEMDFFVIIKIWEYFPHKNH